METGLRNNGRSTKNYRIYKDCLTRVGCHPKGLRYPKLENDTYNFLEWRYLK